MLNSSFLKEYLLKPLCFTMVVLVSLFFLNKFSYFNFSLASNNNQQTFEVIGTGTVTATPNIVNTTFSIQEKGTTQTNAKNKANDKQNQAIQTLTSLGIKKTDIKTTNFNVSQNYEDSSTPVGTMMYPVRRTVQNGYVANITTNVKSDKIDLLNQAIDKLTVLGISVGGVNYTFEDPEVYKAQAVDKAVKDAKTKAENLAKAAGFKLGKLVSIRDVNDVNNFQPQGAPMMKANATDTSTPTDLQPGSNDITAKIAITYYIKN